MPDSPPPPSDPRAGKRGSSHSGTVDRRRVSTNQYDHDGACLAAPPRDVGRMLERYGTALPRYLDAHRLREIEGSHQRWPLLRPAHRPEPGDAQ